MKLSNSRLAGLAIGLGLLVATAGPASALTFNFDDPNGVDNGRVCESAEPTCDIVTNDFALGSFGSATGTITWAANLASISITVPSVTFVGDYDGVETIVLTNVTYSVSGWSAFDFASTGIFTGLGSKVGTVSGTYEQFDGSSVSVSGPTAFSESVAFSALTCTYMTPSAVCGFTAGALRDFQLAVGAVTPASHDFITTLNLAAPEPGTAVLVGLGLFGMALRRRRSH